MDDMIDNMLLTKVGAYWGHPRGSLYYSLYFCMCLKFSLIKSLKIIEKKQVVYNLLGSLQWLLKKKNIRKFINSVKGDRNTQYVLFDQ